MKKIFFIFCGVLLCFNYVEGSWYNNGVGVRATALGGAFVSLADDVSAIYWNPAGITNLNYWEMAEFTYEKRDWFRHESTKIFPSLLGIVYPYLPWKISLGLGYLDLYNFSYKITQDEFENYTGTWIENSSMQINRISISLGKKINEVFSMGTNINYSWVKNYRSLDIGKGENVFSLSANKVTWDTGILLKPLNFLSLGVVYQSGGKYFYKINKLDYEWEVPEWDVIPEIMEGGMDFHYKATHLLLGVGSLKWSLYKNRAGVGTKSNQFPFSDFRKIRMGLATAFWERRIRAGVGLHISNSESILEYTSVSCGLGISWECISWDTSLEFGGNGFEERDVLRSSLSYRFQ